MAIYERKGTPYLQYDFTVCGLRYRGSTKTEDTAEAKRFERRIKSKIKENLAERVLKKEAAHKINRVHLGHAWKKLRYKALLRSQGRCEACGNGRKQNVILHVDHIKPKKYFPELTLNLNNLQVLCQDCNLGKGTEDETDWQLKT